MYLFIYLGFYVAFNTVQVISRWVVGRAEETSTYSSLGLCTVNCRPTASNYQLSHLRPSRGSNPGLRGGRRECYHSTTVAPECLCKKMEKLNITVQEGYPSRTSEAAGLARDQFVKPPKTLKWYGMHCEKDFSRSKVHTWTNEPARMNSTFPRIANRSLPSAPASRPVSKENLRKWERAAHDQSYMCNHY